MKTDPPPRGASVDTSDSGWMKEMREHIRDLGSRGAEVSGHPANMILELRVQPGGRAAAESLIEFGRRQNVRVIIKVFP